MGYLTGFVATSCKSGYLMKSVTLDDRLKKPARSSSKYVVIIIFILLAPAYAVSCNPEEWEAVDCSDCFVDRPAEAEINVKVTISNLNPFVPVNVYQGRIDEEILILTDTVRSPTWTAVLPADQYYTVTATYRYRANWEWITAIDGSHVRTRRVSAACDFPCWTVRGNNFNVRLRY